MDSAYVYVKYDANRVHLYTCDEVPSVYAYTLNNIDSVCFIQHMTALIWTFSAVIKLSAQGVVSSKTSLRSIFHKE